MEYYKRVILKDGRECILRNGTGKYGEAVLNIFLLTHGQTDYLTSYPDECTMTAESEGTFLQKQTESLNGIEILSEVDGKVVGTAGIGAIGGQDKVKHRAEFGVSVDKSYWALGIGSALTEACVACAEKAGFHQLELEVVSDNQPAVNLYKNIGFVEYGRNPKGFLSRFTGWQELILMRLEINPNKEKDK